MRRRSHAVPAPVATRGSRRGAKRGVVFRVRANSFGHPGVFRGGSCQLEIQDSGNPFVVPAWQTTKSLDDGCRGSGIQAHYLPAPKRRLALDFPCRLSLAAVAPHGRSWRALPPAWRGTQELPFVVHKALRTTLLGTACVNQLFPFTEAGSCLTSASSAT